MGNPAHVRLEEAREAKGHTFLGLVAVEIAVGNGARGLERGNDGNADDGLGDVSDISWHRAHWTDLDGQQEKVQVEVDAGKHIFVRRRHQDRRAAVCENGEKRALSDSGLAVSPLSWADRGRGGSEILGRGHLVLVVLLIVGHCVSS